MMVFLDAWISVMVKISQKKDVGLLGLAFVLCDFGMCTRLFSRLESFNGHGHSVTFYPVCKLL